MLQELHVKDENAKTEVVAAYHEVLHKLTETKKNVSTDENKEPKKEVIKDPIAEENKRVVEEVLQSQPEDLLKNFDQFKKSLNDSLEEMRHIFTDKKKTIDTITAAIETKKNEIANLHDIEVNINTLSALIIANKEKSISLENGINEQRQAFEQEISKKKYEWNQEEQKYNFQRDLNREKDRNRYESALRDQEQELTALRQKTHKELDEREAKISMSEAEYQQLKERISQFPEELGRVAQKAEEATTKQLTLRFDYERQLMQKEIKLCEQTIATLEIKTSMLEKNIAHFESLKSSFNQLLFTQMENDINKTS